MPTLAALQSSADAVFDALWTSVGTRQGVFLAGNGRYFQGLLTTPVGSITNSPNDVAPVTVSLVPTLTGHPTDQAETWVNFAAGVPGAMPCAVELHTYRTPAGVRGYLGRCWIRWSGGLYERTNQSGPEAYRVHTWQAVVGT